MLIGGGGADWFCFDATLSPTNVDRLADFTPGQDVIGLSLAYFTSLSAGQLAPTSFVVGRSAITSDQHIVYNAANGMLFYDIDGRGGIDQILIARLDDRPSITANDFFVL